MEEIKQPTVLVVDDDSDTRALLGFCLTGRYLVIEATNGLEALTLAAHRAPDLILMDIAMPVLNGLEATRQLKDNSKTKDIPVICISAFSSNDSMFRNAIECGAAQCLSKPIVRDELLKCIGKYLDPK